MLKKASAQTVDCCWPCLSIGFVCAHMCIALAPVGGYKPGVREGMDKYTNVIDSLAKSSTCVMWQVVGVMHVIVRTK